MKILNHKIEWCKFNDGLPYFEFKVDSIPKLEELTFEQKGGAYFAEQDGFVRYFYHNPNNELGYGGRAFNLNLPTGMVKIVGPWSSNSKAMNYLGFKKSVEANLLSQGTSIFSAVTWDLVYSYFNSLTDCEICIVEYDDQIRPSLMEDKLVKPRTINNINCYRVFESIDKRYLVKELEDFNVNSNI